MFDPHYQTSYTDSWSVGFQRDARQGHCGRSPLHRQPDRGRSPATVNYNEQDIYNAGFGGSASFLDEFQQGAEEPRGQRRGGQGRDLRLHRHPGHVTAADLPGELPGSRAGQRDRSDASTPARSSATPRRSRRCRCSRRTSARSRRPTRPTGCSATPTFQANGIAAGMPANFWVMNPDVIAANLRDGGRLHEVPHDAVPREPPADEGAELQRQLRATR